jgi:hypothetical protein
MYMRHLPFSVQSSTRLVRSLRTYHISILEWQGLCWQSAFKWKFKCSLLMLYCYLHSSPSLSLRCCSVLLFWCNLFLGESFTGSDFLNQVFNIRNIIVKNANQIISKVSYANSWSRCINDMLLSVLFLNQGVYVILPPSIKGCREFI